MELIDKDKIVAEIEKLKAYLQIPNAQLEAIKVCDNVISVINTLETKEVDFEKEWKEYFKYRGDMATVNIIHLAKHFFELGLNAKKGK